MVASCVYSGWVMHRRLGPTRHQFRYRAWWLLLDLDEVDALDKKLHLFSRGVRNLISFHDSDHGHDGSDLRTQIARKLEANGIGFDGGPIRLLCAPRVLGYQFNPLSIYFCYLRDGQPAAVVYEVHNTFGERHSYCLDVGTQHGGIARQSCDKRLYVSPFMGMEISYDFRVVLPTETLTVGITGSEGGRPLLNAVLQAKRLELSDWRLLALLISHPFVTRKVIAAIHFEAFRLWRKGLPVHSHLPVSRSSYDKTASECPHEPAQDRRPHKRA